MALRKCSACGGDLPAGATARAKYCSATCRQRGHRNGVEPVALAIVPPAPERAPAAPSDRLAALETAVARLERLLDEADPRSAAPLNKEYRETLRELEAVRGESQAEGERERSASRRRPFSAAAI